MSKGVLLVNLGSPDSPSVSDVRRYLNEFLMDSRVIDVAWPIRRFVVGMILINRPKESARNPPEALPAGLPFHSLEVHFLGIELVTRVRVSAKLPPELLDGNPLADPLPKISKL